MSNREMERFHQQLHSVELPENPGGYQQFWNETFIRGIRLLRSVMEDTDPDRAMRALALLIDLEKTRLRHHNKLSGTHQAHLPPLEIDVASPFAQMQILAPLAPITGSKPEPIKAQPVAATPVAPAAPLKSAPLNAPVKVPRVVRGHPGMTAMTSFLRPPNPAAAGICLGFHDTDDDWKYDIPGEPIVKPGKQKSVPLDSPVHQRYPDPAGSSNPPP